MKYSYTILLGLMFIFTSCDFFKSEKSKSLDLLNDKLTSINEAFKGKKIVLNKSLSDKIFKNKKEGSYSILVYYDANCSVCFTELEKWKDLIMYFKKTDADLNIIFILYTDDKLLTKVNLEDSEFPIELVVFDDRNSYLNDYRHLVDKPYNTTLIDEDNEILFIGSPLKSENLKNYYTKIINNK